MTLLTSVPRGLALIGMSAGQTASIPRQDGAPDVLRLDAVLYQPENAAEPDAVERTLARTVRPPRLTPIAWLSAYRK